MYNTTGSFGNIKIDMLKLVGIKNLWMQYFVLIIIKEKHPHNHVILNCK